MNSAAPFIHWLLPITWFLVNGQKKWENSRNWNVYVGQSKMSLCTHTHTHSHDEMDQNRNDKVKTKHKIFEMFSALFATWIGRNTNVRLHKVEKMNKSSTDTNEWNTISCSSSGFYQHFLVSTLRWSGGTLESTEQS